jgi:hypothetical protein
MSGITAHAAAVFNELTAAGFGLRRFVWLSRRARTVLAPVLGAELR